MSTALWVERAGLSHGIFVTALPKNNDGKILKRATHCGRQARDDT